MIKQTIGIIGGMGPLATSNLVHTIYSMYGVDKEWELPHLVVDFNTEIPSRGRFFAGLGPSPSEALRASARMLENAGATVIGVGCITAHHFIEEVRSATTATVLDAVTLTCDQLAIRGLSRPFLLGSEATCGGPLFIDDRFELITPSSDKLGKVRQMIEDIKTYRITVRTDDLFRSLLAEATENGADSVILGCSELSLMKERFGTSEMTIGDLAIVDPIRLLATEVYRLDSLAKGAA